MLINLRFAADETFSSMKNHETLWNKITEELKSKMACDVSKTQVIDKWKNLKGKYTDVKDANNKTGNDKVEWKYISVFDDFYGMKASTSASFTYDSGVRQWKNCPSQGEKREFKKKKRNRIHLNKDYQTLLLK